MTSVVKRNEDILTVLPPHSTSLMTKTFSDTTRVTTRCVTTTSRLGHDKVVTISTTTTTIRSKRAKIRIESLEDDSQVRTEPLKPDTAGVMDDIVKTEENENALDEAEESSPFKSESLPQIGDTGKAYSMAKNGNASFKAGTVETRDSSTSPRDNGSLTKRQSAEVSSGQLHSTACCLQSQHRHLPQGRSYKELYYDGFGRY
ncbi:uncharacterized protein LOC143282450 [Babylonia areolata]|uniref:uncharacterized protein LOC143282450 n=1 Tax=Babylonia areolata TaxID=304850 RepID=UPI003FD699A0